MRSSRRNLGLQPELTPEDSDSDEEDIQAISESEVVPQDEQAEDETREEDQVATSDDVNLDDSALSKDTSDSTSEIDDQPKSS